MTMQGRMMWRGRHSGRVAITLLVLAVVGCSDHSVASSPTTTTQAKPAIDLTGVTLRDVPAGKGVPQATATATGGVGEASLVGPSATLSPDYAETEYLLSGTAATYSGPATGPVTQASTGNPYVTRILVRRPKQQSKFSGRVIVEPMNTSGGDELDAMWQLLAPMLESQGDAWVGVTERASSVQRLQQFDPVRYADLHLPVNDDAWDILRQVGGLLKAGGDHSPLAGWAVEHLYMAGYSQSGVETATFVSAFHERTLMSDKSPLYDGYMPEARDASLTPPQSGTAVVPTLQFGQMRPVGVPVMDVETQTDVEGFKAEIGPGVVYTNQGGATVRRDDADTSTDKYRLDELPGAPHAPHIPGCVGDASTFPTSDFIQAAYANLIAWAEHGKAPAEAHRIELATTGTVSKAREDASGNALGGIRSPFVDVPLVNFDVHSTPLPTNTTLGATAFCALSGSETPLPADVLAAKYKDVNAYMSQFTKSLDATIEAGFLRSADRAGILRAARAQAQSILGTR
jgi:hypothetical protein